MFFDQFKSICEAKGLKITPTVKAVGFSLFFVTRRGFAGFWCGAPHRGDVKINAIMEIALRSKVLTEIAHEICA